MEIWKDVVGLEEIAEVSSLGRVRSKPRNIMNHGALYLRPARMMAGSNNGLGYLQVRFTVDGRTIRKYVHRMVAEAFINNPQNLRDVNHKDGVKSNNDVKNLEWLSRAENIKHALDTGLLKKESNGRFI